MNNDLKNLYSELFQASLQVLAETSLQAALLTEREGEAIFKELTRLRTDFELAANADDLSRLERLSDELFDLGVKARRLLD